MRKTCSRRVRTFALGVVAAGVTVFTACSVQVLTNPDDGKPLVVTFRLGDVGLFTLSPGAPISHSARVTNLQKPATTPDRAALQIDASDVVVTPLGNAQGVDAEAINGSFTMQFRIGPGSSQDPCTDGVLVGTISASVSGGQVTLIEQSLSLTPAALGYVMSGDFTLCMTAEADFNGVVTVGEISFSFQSSAGDDNDVTPPGDGDQTSNTNDNGTDSTDDGPDNVNDNASDDPGDVDDDPDDEPGDDPDDNANGNGSSDDDITDDPDHDNENTNDNDNDTPDDDDNADDDEPDEEARLIYTNLTNDQDQDPDTGFDTFNKHASISGDGRVVAYLSNTDRTGEGTATPNFEVMVMVDGVKTQITQTTEITNTSQNTYDVTNFTPVVSRDGSVVVFGSDGDLLNSGVTGAEQIYAYYLDNGGTGQLSQLDTPAGGMNSDTVGAPRVSATGNAIAWIENDTECPQFACAVQSRLRLRSAGGTDLLTVVFDENVSFSDYTLSGDGSTILFTSSRDPVGQNEGGRNQLFRMSASDGGISQISSIPASGTPWSAFYASPGANHDASRIAVWTNDPVYTDTEDHVLVLIDATGNLITTIARAQTDFPGGEDEHGRPRFAGGADQHLCFYTAWTFSFAQRNFRATISPPELLEVGIGYHAVGPSITDDGRFMVITGLGDAFYPNQATLLNPDYNDEVWIVEIRP